MRIAICSDNRKRALVLKQMVLKWSSDQNIEADLDYYETTDAFIQRWSYAVHYDLAFLSLQTGDSSFIQLVQRIQRQDQKMILMFVTGIIKYMQRDKLSAIRYLVWPLKQETVSTALSKACEEVLQDNVIATPVNGNHRNIEKNNIYFAEKCGNHIIIHTTHGCFRYNGKMIDLKRRLAEPQFCMCHRSLLVNLIYAGRLSRRKMEIMNGEEVPVGRNFWVTLNECFISYFIAQQR